MAAAKRQEGKSLQKQRRGGSREGLQPSPLWTPFPCSNYLTQVGWKL